MSEKIIYSIEVKETPNPNTLQFLFNEELFNGNNISFSFENLEQAHGKSDLAAEILRLKEASQVFINNDSMSVTLVDGHHWSALKIIVVTTILDYLNSGQEVIKYELQKEESAARNYRKTHITSENDLQILATIEQLLDEHILPAVAEDGGHIELDRFEDGVVYVKLQGACNGCPSSSVTLKNGIENMLKHYVPEVLEVRQV